MIAFFSRRAYGRIEAVGGTFLVTDFVCVNFLPVVPRETHLVLARAPNGECTSVRIPLRLASVCAGYGRAWGGMGVVVSLFVTLAAGSDAERGTALAVLGVSALVCAASWLLVGRVGPEERARREVYRLVTDVPVDPAWLPEDRRRELGDRLRAEVGARAVSLARATYREAPGAAWEEVALDPAVTDVDFLRRAAVLARVESGDADASAKRRLKRVHDEACRRCVRAAAG